jgi:hypothetical protein
LLSNFNFVLTASLVAENFHSPHHMRAHDIESSRLKAYLGSIVKRRNKSLPQSICIPLEFHLERALEGDEEARKTLKKLPHELARSPLHRLPGRSLEKVRENSRKEIKVQSFSLLTNVSCNKNLEKEKAKISRPASPSDRGNKFFIVFLLVCSSFNF